MKMDDLIEFLNEGEKRKFALLSLGCKVNQAELNSLGDMIRSSGHVIVKIDESPDICIINTCTVTQKSDYQSRQLIRRANKAGAGVLATGCYAELNPDIVRDMEGVIGIISNREKELIINKNKEVSKSNALGRSRYFLKIQDGCNQSCSYCIIPKARGESRSIEREDVIKLVKEAVFAGYNEVVLTGIHLGQYGHNGCGISKILKEILEKTDIKRLRMSSIEVNEIDSGILELFRDRRLARHLHIPLQSGDDGILKKMNRRYDLSFYKDNILKIKDKYPDICLGTDVIAGFPGEGEREFSNTLRFIEGMPFTYIHVFPYSERKGTEALKLNGKVESKEIKKRCSILREASEAKKEEFMKRHIGETLDILLEEEASPGVFKGTSSNYMKITAYCKEGMRGNIVPVRVSGYKEKTLYGIANTLQISL